jgi:hypothetical protein
MFLLLQGFVQARQAGLIQEGIPTSASMPLDVNKRRPSRGKKRMPRTSGARTAAR